MCQGWYDGEYGQPVIDASVIIPAAAVGHEVSFLVDTGSDTTCLSGLDAVRAGLFERSSDDGPEVAADLDYEEIQVQGVDETTAYEIETSVMLAFEEYDDDLDRWSLHIELLESVQVVPRSPRSLLGRDVLDRFEVTFSKRSERVDMQRRNFADGPYLCIGLDEEASPDLRQFE